MPSVPETDPLVEPRPDFDEQAVARLLAEHYGVDGTLEEVHGERDLNFRVETGGGRRYLFKLHNPADSEEVVAMRTAAMARVRGVDPDLPLPPVVPTSAGDHFVAAAGRDGRRSQVQLFGFLEGRHPGPDELDERALVAWGATVARLARALRGFTHPEAAYRIQWDLRHAAALRDRLEVVEALGSGARVLVETVLDRFDERVGPLLPGLRAQVAHNDMSRTNVLVDERSRIVGITDFGDMTHTALVCDLAVAIADVVTGGSDPLAAAEAMAAGYRSVTALEPGEAALLGDLVATRAATDAVLTTWQFPQHPHIASLPTASIELLSRFERDGFPAVAARLEAAASGLPWRPRPTAALLAARRRVLGPLETSYDEPLHLVSGSGVHLVDSGGRRYLDAYNNVPVVGHCHPAVADAVAAQARRLVTNTRYLQEAHVELAERLVAVAPPGLDRVLLVSSGSEANDLAWRIARLATGGSGALVTRFAYHGVTQATTDLSPEEWPTTYRPAHVGLLAPPAAPGDGGDPARVVEQLAAAGHPPAALVVDPAFTSDGILGPATAWIAAAAEAVRGAGGLVVADEVQAGYGRTGGSLWSITPSKVDPDLLTLGKPMGNGVPVAAVLGPAALVDPFVEVTGYFSTFGGNTLACAAALAVLDVIEREGIVAHAATVGAVLHRRLAEVVARHEAAGALRAWGLLCGVDIVDGTGAPAPARAAALVNALRRLGVLVGTTGPNGNVVKIRPPLVLEAVHAEEIAGRLDEAFGILTEL